LAVGFESQPGGAELNQSLHWNGTRWLIVSVPQPGGTASGDGNELLAVACASASNCWGAGWTEAGPYPAPTLNEVLHWNGTHWSQVSTPEPGGTASGASNELGILGGGVTCVSASNCWATGFTRAGSGTPQLNQVLHWDGTTWNPVSTPEPGGTDATDTNELAAVICRSASNCSAVGIDLPGTSSATLNQVLHWNGHNWVPVSVINPGGNHAGGTNELIDVACPGPALTNCLAVGAQSTNTTTSSTLNEALHWTGGTWLGTPTPQPGGVNPGDVSELIGVACPSASNCWAVGALGTNSAPANQILHWNGHSWVMG
jgi:hypothetical protein